MIEKKMRMCAVCRENYTFCPRCNEDKDKPTWYFTFCSSNCKDIYDVTSKFENGQLSAEDAKEMLNKLDLSKLDNFGNSYKNSIAKIKSMLDVTTLESIKVTDMNTDTPVVIEEVTKVKSRKKAKRNVE